jgi:hypothetical protein
VRTIDGGVRNGSRPARNRPGWGRPDWTRLDLNGLDLHRLDRLDWNRLDWDRADWNRAGRIAGGLTGTAAAAAGLSVALLMRQAADARRIIPMAEAPPPRGDGLYGPKFGGKPLNMVILGDSSAAGYGVHRPRETPGALLATTVSPWSARCRPACPTRWTRPWSTGPRWRSS